MSASSSVAGGRSRSVPPSLRMTSTASAAVFVGLDANACFLAGEQFAFDRRSLEHDLERVRLGGGGEHVVGLLGLGQREAMGGENGRVEPAALDQPHQLRG